MKSITSLHKQLFHFLPTQRIIGTMTATAIAITFAGCKKTPESIIPQEEMAQLMADVHIGEAMIDFNYSTYPNDSTRKLLKQSIYQAHNVSAEKVDTSYAWYGHHIEEYIKVYDRTIEIIQERQRDIASSNNTTLSVAGDSVQIWSGPQRLSVHSKMPSRVITFSFSPDSTWQKGDLYTLCYKPINPTGAIKSSLLIDYSNGTTEYVNEPDTRQPKSELKIQVDTTLTPVKIYGYMILSPEKNHSYEIDSISVTRIRKDLIRNTYHTPYKTFSYGQSHAEDLANDTIKTGTEPDNVQIQNKPKRPPYKMPRHDMPSENLPKPSAETRRTTEHRYDAKRHKPTAAQRKEAALQRSQTGNTALKKRPVSSQPL